MARVGYSSDNVAPSVFNLDRLKLQKEEVARVLCIEQDALFEHVHYVENENDKEARGSFICLGDPKVLGQEGYDDNCPLCEAARTYSCVGQSSRRFLSYIFKYRTTKKGVLEKPLSASLLLWVFGEGVYSNLVKKREEWGDLRKHDLLLGPCQAERFQKFSIEICSDALWLKDEQLKAMFIQTYKESKFADAELTKVLGRRVDANAMMGIVRKSCGVAPSVDATVGVVASGDLDLDSILNPTVKEDSEVASSSEGTKKAQVKKDAKPEVASEVASSVDLNDTMDFDALLNDI